MSTRFRRGSAWFFALLAAAIYLALALTRRLNFDEALALRAGWLDLAHIQASPAFLMPWTLFAGAVGHLVRDPGAVFMLLRGAVVLGVSVSFVLAARAADLRMGGVAVAAWLALASAAFATHGLEFRYGSAILILLLLAYRFIVRGSPFWLGTVSGLMALHHLKGAFFATGTIVVATILFRRRRRDVLRIVLGAVLALGSWTLLVAGLGLLPRFVASLADFYALAEGAVRAPLAQTMGPVLRRDLAWWCCVLVALIMGALRRKEEKDRRLVALLALATLGISFWVLHPHAWPYLAALPTPFLCLAAASAIARARPAFGAAALALLVGLIVQFEIGAPPPFAHLVAAARAPMKPEVTLLRAVRKGFARDDRVLDPSGILYFVPPCTEQWYLDGLYAQRLAAGRWMADLRDDVPSRCTLALDTYRLAALPPQALDDLRRRFRPVAGGLLAREGRDFAMDEETLVGIRRVESFW